MSNVHAVILAGGIGSRLWPLSRQHLPKQFLALGGDTSLLQTTIERLSPVIDPGSVLIVTQETHAKGEASKVNFPWGNYTVLEEDQEGFKIKRIEVAPGARLSLQSHSRRPEHWVVVSGTATVTNGNGVTTVHKNQSTYIPIGAKRRLENLGSEPLHIVEIQVGEYLGQDDISTLRRQLRQINFNQRTVENMSMQSEARKRKREHAKD